MYNSYQQITAYIILISHTLMSCSHPQVGKDIRIHHIAQQEDQEDEAVGSTGKVLISRAKANIHARDQAGHTPLHLAMQKGYTQLAIYLLDLGASLYTRNQAGFTPLHLGFQHQQLGLVQEILQQQPDFEPLHFAIQSGDLSLVQQLVELGINPHATDPRGRTGLHLAAYQGNVSIVKYLLAQAHVQPLCMDQQGKTPLDLALANNHTELVAYLRAWIGSTFQEKRAEIQAQLTHEFEKRLTEPLQQLQTYDNHIDPSMFNPHTLATQWLEILPAILQGTWTLPPATTEETPNLRPHVDEFLQGIQEGVQQQVAEMPAYREQLQNLSLESLRPYAAALVKQWNEAQEEKIKTDPEEPKKEKPAKPIKIQPSTQAPTPLKDPTPSPGYGPPINPYIEKRPVRSIKHAFIPASRSGNMRRIREYMGDLQAYLAEAPADRCLLQQKEEVTFVFQRIQKEKRQLTRLYRALKCNIDHRAGDILFLQQDIRKLDRASKEKFEQDAQIIREDREDAALAKQLLEQLQALQKELAQILRNRNEDLSDYVEKGYESDYNNDYTSQELTAYLVQIGQIPATNQAHALVSNLHNNLERELVTIIEKLGQPEPVTEQDLITQLQDLPALTTCITTYYQAQAASQSAQPTWEDITGLVLHALVTSSPTPIGASIQLQEFTQVKKRIHRFRMAMKYVIEELEQKLVIPQANK